MGATLRHGESGTRSNGDERVDGVVAPVADGAGAAELADGLDRVGATIDRALDLPLGDPSAQAHHRHVL
jgi:hypothetical protein